MKMAGEVTKDVRISRDESLAPLNLVSEEQGAPKGVLDVSSGPDREDEDGSGFQVLYGIEDTPPWHTCVLLGFQHYMTVAGMALSLSAMLCGLMCMETGDPSRSAIVSTIVFVSGIVTLLQTTIGVRLPITQGGSGAFLSSAVIILTSRFESCSSLDITNATSAEVTDIWQTRIREVSGAIAMASVLQVVLGFTGLVGVMLRWITPLAIAPTISLIGLSLFEYAGNMASQNWGIAILTMLLIALFSQLLGNVPITLRRNNQSSTKVYIFKLYPVLLSIMISWSLCAILTSADLLPEGDKARTDLVPDLLTNTPWFRVPYPGQFGAPTASVSGFVGMIAAVISSMIESIGDYYACAKIAGAPPPPVSAVNRGIFIEGIGCILTSVWGTASGTTSFSENVGTIAITKVGSRRVVQYAAVIMMLLGLMGKIGAVFLSIPEPIVGGLLCVMFSVITGVGLSSLQFVNLNSSRNIFVIGSSLFIGLVIPRWVKANQGSIKTGSMIADQTLTILLETSMFVGGLIGFLLDNMIPGTPKDRGLLEWRASLRSQRDDQELEGTGGVSIRTNRSYNLPFAMDFIRRIEWLKYFPISPTYSGHIDDKGSEDQSPERDEN